MEWPTAEQQLASAIQYLIHGDERTAALLLLSCESEYNRDYANGSSFAIDLLGPREVYDALKFIPADEFESQWEYDQVKSDIEWKAANALHDQVFAAFKAVAPPGSYFVDFRVCVTYSDIQPGWREELLEIAEGRRVHNQGVEIPGREIIEWGNLRFRSQTEVRIAKALDTIGVLFLPNCLARLNREHTRITKEADFLVCQNGKWGILEVDGPYHPRAATDNARDRLFQAHGIKVTQRFTAEEC